MNKKDPRPQLKLQNKLRGRVRYKKSHVVISVIPSANEFALDPNRSSNYLDITEKISSNAVAAIRRKVETSIKVK